MTLLDCRISLTFEKLFIPSKKINFFTINHPTLFISSRASRMHTRHFIREPALQVQVPDGGASHYALTAALHQGKEHNGAYSDD